LASETKNPVTLTDEDIEVEVVTRRSLLLKAGLAAGILGGAVLAGASPATARRVRRGGDPSEDTTDRDRWDDVADSSDRSDSD
jgi:hypothetical protein